MTDEDISIIKKVTGDFPLIAVSSDVEETLTKGVFHVDVFVGNCSVDDRDKFLSSLTKKDQLFYEAYSVSKKHYWNPVTVLRVRIRTWFINFSGRGISKSAPGTNNGFWWKMRPHAETEVK